MSARVKIGAAAVVPLPVSEPEVDACIVEMLKALREHGVESAGLLLMVESVRQPSGELALEIRGQGEASVVAEVESDLIP